MSSPYLKNTEKSFWRTGVANKKANTLEYVYQPKFSITKKHRIVSLGSCFAQHIARNMRNRGWTVIDKEPAPPGLSKDLANNYGFELFSARVGNIYYMRQLLQLYEEAFGLWKPVDAVWEKNGKYYDAFRPSVEPYGLAAAQEVILHRNKHLISLRKMFIEADVIVFTLGLTEGWIHKVSEEVYATAPGTIAGVYNPDLYSFKNFRFNEIYDDFIKFMNYMKKLNSNIKFLLTVSPVPLTATATDNHILVAANYSKSVLRAVAGELSTEFDCVDYFPSYDILTSVLGGAKFYKDNLRTVTHDGIQLAMDTFFSAHCHNFSDGCQLQDNYVEDKMNFNDSAENEFCDDLLLEAFSK
jgi:hypothetical protein